MSVGKGTIGIVKSGFSSCKRHFVEVERNSSEISARVVRQSGTIKGFTSSVVACKPKLVQVPFCTLCDLTA